MKELLFILTTTAGTVTLDISPDGWDESLIQWSRSDKYWGVFRSFTVPLKFVKGISPRRNYGATQLREEFYTYGTAGIASIVIQRLNKVTLQYSTAYSGVCDFGTFKDTDNYVEINLVDAGIAKDLKDNESTDYTLEQEVFEQQINFVVPFVGTKVGRAASFKKVAFGLIDKMTGGRLTTGEYVFKSDLLDSWKAETPGLLDKYFLSSGNGLRLAPFNTLKTTFKDFFDAVNMISCVGIGIKMEIEPISGELKPTIRLEAKINLFDFVAPHTVLGETKTISVAVDIKLSINKIKVGSPSKDDTVQPVTNEPNAQSNWIVNNNTSSVEYDLSCKYRTDSIKVIEILTDGDDDADDDVFILELHDYDPYTGNGMFFDNNTNVRQTGTPGTVWHRGNATLSARQCLIKNLDFISSLLYNYVGGDITFVNGENDLPNIEIQKYGTGSYVAEKTTVTLLAPAYFVPITFEIECALPINLIVLLNENSHGIAEFTYKGETYYGWVMDVKAKLSGRGSGKIKLLALPINDLTKLIR